MATQVKFYSTTAASYSAIESKDAGGVYFVNGGELYKGTSRFGANKVYSVSNQTQLSAITDQIAGDLAVGFGWTKAWNGTAWVQIENDTQIKAMVSLMTSNLASGNANSYITHITQDANGNVTAHAQAFPTLATGDSDGQVKLGSTNVSVSGWDTLAGKVSTNMASIGSLGLRVSTLESKVSDIEGIVDVANNTVSAATGNFTNLNVSDTATFVATTVSASSLTIGGSTVEQLADKQIASIAAVTKTGTSNGITVSVTTEAGSVKVVSVDATAFGNVMKFRGVVASTADVTSPASGDIVIIGSSPTGGAVTGQEYIYDGTKWELIGDQNTYATKAYVDTSVASAYNLASNAYALANAASNTAVQAYNLASTAYGQAYTALSAAQSAYFLASSANTSAQAAYASAITNAVKTSAGITTTAGNLVTASAVAEYVTGKIDDAALVWLDASGSPIN